MPIFSANTGNLSNAELIEKNRADLETYAASNNMKAYAKEAECFNFIEEHKNDYRIVKAYKRTNGLYIFLMEGNLQARVPQDKRHNPFLIYISEAITNEKDMRKVHAITHASGREFITKIDTFEDEVGEYLAMIKSLTNLADAHALEVYSRSAVWLDDIKKYEHYEIEKVCRITPDKKKMSNHRWQKEKLLCTHIFLVTGNIRNPKKSPKIYEHNKFLVRITSSNIGDYEKIRGIIKANGKNVYKSMSDFSKYFKSEECERQQKLRFIEDNPNEGTRVRRLANFTVDQEIHVQTALPGTAIGATSLISGGVLLAGFLFFRCFSRKRRVVNTESIIPRHE